MKIIFIFITLLLLVNSCNSEKKGGKLTLQNNDVHSYLNKLDSIGFDISNDSLLFEIGNDILHMGKNKVGNELIDYAFSIRKVVSSEDYRHASVRNTKNGNYSIAIDKLEKAMEIDSQEVSGYYAWVLLYYYRDYEKSLQILEEQDSYTPDFSDAPVGEDIHYLKGLCHMQMQHYQKAVDEFNIYINTMVSTIGEEWVDVYTFVQKGRCLTKLEKFENAINSYDKAIKYYENCTEAYYFKGLTQIKMSKDNEGCNNFNKALELINDGNKSSDVYVEYFHEIYLQQIEESITEHCK